MKREDGAKFNSFNADTAPATVNRLIQQIPLGKTREGVDLEFFQPVSPETGL